MERSWDYIVKSPVGMGLAIAASFLVMAFIVAGGIFMRLEMRRQREKLQKARSDADLG